MGRCRDDYIRLPFSLYRETGAHLNFIAGTYLRSGPSTDYINTTDLAEMLGATNGMQS